MTPRAPSDHPELAFGKPSRRDRLGREAIEHEQELLRRGEIRHDVIVRSGGRCEFCRIPVPPGELHHILGGIGRRRRDERVDTVAFICVACHHAYHRGDEDVLWWAKSWANAHGFAESLAEITRRIEKIHEARWAGLRSAS